MRLDPRVALIGASPDISATPAALDAAVSAKRAGLCIAGSAERMFGRAYTSATISHRLSSVHADL